MVNEKEFHLEKYFRTKYLLRYLKHFIYGISRNAISNFVLSCIVYSDTVKSAQYNIIIHEMARDTNCFIIASSFFFIQNKQ